MSNGDHMDRVDVDLELLLRAFAELEWSVAGVRHALERLRGHDLTDGEFEDLASSLRLLDGAIDDYTRYPVF